ncbi:cell division protein FtsB [Ideonella sp. B7]|uniref:cell division protein FtsB n=1 Tax=Ideonella benzenivorans TaxID=2831643 RepID=UPI001CECD421|nr:cell division protein FtsB [Ideonella benzenivorans]MCA6217677.1 cell division protein FtsB [Ideonella benzenivorans]
MRALPIILAALLLIVQAELWFGRGGVSHVMELQREVVAQRSANDQARARNDRLQAEVTDLREGLEMVEEKARLELGMIRPDEMLVVVSPAPSH